VMHDGMQYDPDSRSRSRALGSWKSFQFETLTPPLFKMADGNY